MIRAVGGEVLAVTEDGSELTYVREELDRLNALRLAGAFSAAEERRYRVLCERESELLGEGRCRRPGQADGS